VRFKDDPFVYDVEKNGKQFLFSSRPGFLFEGDVNSKQIGVNEFFISILSGIPGRTTLELYANCIILSVSVYDVEKNGKQFLFSSRPGFLFEGDVNSICFRMMNTLKTNSLYLIAIKISNSSFEYILKVFFGILFTNQYLIHHPYNLIWK